jgi:hypothetical protein
MRSEELRNVGCVDLRSKMCSLTIENVFSYRLKAREEHMRFKELQNLSG